MGSGVDIDDEDTDEIFGYSEDEEEETLENT